MKTMSKNIFQADNLMFTKITASGCFDNISGISYFTKNIGSHVSDHSETQKATFPSASQWCYFRKLCTFGIKETNRK